MDSRTVAEVDDLDYRVVDADAHYVESISDLVGYFPEPWDKRMELGGYASERWMLRGSSGDRTVYGRIQRDGVYAPGKDGMDPEVIPEVMDYLGVDASIQLSHQMLNFAGVTASDDRPVALANAYIDYMLEEVVDPDEGIYTMAVLPYQIPEAAVELIDRVKDERGIVGFMVVTPGTEPPFGHKRYEPIYEAAEDAGMPVNFHSGGSGLDESIIKGYEKFIETHTLGFLFSNMAQITSVVIQGIPEKFPDLDIVFQESGLAYIPMLGARLDSEYRKRPSEAPLLEKPPSEYLQDFYYSTQPLEDPPNQRYMEEIFNLCGGPSQLMYASDYPHWDFDPPSTISDLPFLDDDDIEQVLSGTAEEVFGI
ncbi:MAG: amidohydrolase family protein [Halobacteriota archaeon]